MSLIHVYKSAFDNSLKTINCEKECSIKQALKDESLNFDFCLINVNGFEKDENYVLKSGDVCTIRQYPSNEKSNNVFKESKWYEKTHTVFEWVVNPIGSLMTGLITGNWNGLTSASKTGNLRKSASNTTISSASASDPNTSDKTIETNPTISGATNTSNEDKPIPFVMGKHLLTPHWVGQPFHTVSGTDGDTEYYTVLYMLGFAPLHISDIKLGYFDLASGKDTNGNYITNGTIPILEDSRYKDVELEIMTGVQTSQLYPQKVKEETLEEQLYNVTDTSGESHVLVLDRFTAKYPQKVEIEFYLKGLLEWDDDGNKDNATVQVKIEYSLDGETYSNFGGITGWTYDENSGISTLTKAKAQEMKFCATRTFTYSELYKDDKCLLNVGAMYLRIQRVNPSSTDTTDLVDDIYLSGIRTWCYDKAQSESKKELIAQLPITERVQTNTVRLAMRIKATEENSDQIKELNMIVRSLGRTWNGTEWSTEYTETQNPSSIALLAHQSPMLGKNTYSDSEIDLDGYGAFYEFCENKGYKCNGVITSQVKLSDLMADILNTGRGFRVLNGDKESVCYDDRKENIVNIINNQNCLSASNSKDLETLPDGYLITFQDENNFYEETDYIVCFNDEDLDKEDIELENLDIPYVTDSKQLYKLGKYHCACKKLRREIWTRELSIDGNLIEIGNLVSLQDDTLTVGIGNGAEIKDLVIENGYITQIVTDGNFEVGDTSKNYGIKIIQANGLEQPKVITKQVEITESGIYNTFTLTEPISVTDSVIPSIADLLSFGEYEKITIEAICASKKENGDGTFDFTFVPYVEEIYSAEEGDIPEFDSKVTSPIRVKSNSFTEKNVTLNTYVNSISTTIQSAVDKAVNGTTESIPSDISNFTVKALENGLEISVSIADTNLNNNLSYIQYQISRDSGATWSDTNKINGTKGTYEFNRKIDGYPEESDLLNYRIRVKAENVYGKVSENWSSETTPDCTTYGTWTLSSPSVSAKVLDRTATLTFSHSRADEKIQYGTIKYLVSIKRLGESADTKYYAPSTNLDPYASENNYKNDASTQDFIYSDNVYIQTLPLYGQDSQNATNTVYQFRVIAENEATTSEPTETTITALVTNIRDIVISNETTKESYVEKLSAISANVGLIQKGGFGDFKDQTNYWALSTLSAEDAGTTEKVYEGSFRVGGSNEYLKVEPVIDESTSTPTGEYKISLKAGDISFSSSGISNAQLVDGVYITDDSNPNRKLFLTSNGIIVQNYNSTSGLWENVAKIYVDKFNNMILTNSEESPQIGTDLSNIQTVYHFDETLLDQNGLNSKNIAIDAEMATYGNGIVDNNKAVINTVTFTNTDNANKGIGFWTKANEVLINDNVTDCELGTSEVNQATIWNTNASTDWGLTDTQIASGIFKSFYKE